jgi:hypothetical protein
VLFARQWCHCITPTLFVADAVEREEGREERRSLQHLRYTSTSLSTSLLFPFTSGDNTSSILADATHNFMANFAAAQTEGITDYQSTCPTQG